MKILHLTTHLNMGGIARYVTNLAKALKERTHTVFVASGGGELEGILSGEGIKHILLDIRTKSELSPKIIKSFFTLRPFLRKEKIDLLHAHTRVTQVLAALLSFYEKVPYVSTCHGFFKKRLSRKVFGCWGQRVMAISEAVRNQLVHSFKVDEDKVVTINTGIEIERFLKDVPQEERKELKHKWNLEEAIVIGTIGRLSPIKGQEVLIRAAKKLIDGYPNIKILLIGNGPDEKRLKRLTHNLELDGNIIFAGTVKDTTKALSVIDIFVLPSINEGLGLSLAEAMAAGIPCVASRIGGIESLIENGVTGILFRVGDPDSLASAIRYILENKEKRECFKREARKKVINDFNIERMASQVEKVYSELLDEKKFFPRKKILIFNVNWLGDVIFSSPFVRSVRETFPDSYIACAAPLRCKEIIEANTRINEFIAFDENGSEKTFFGKMKFALRLRKEKFDIAFILHRSLTRALITFIAGIKMRIGYDTKGRGFLLTKRLKVPAGYIHRVEYFLELAKAIGAGVSRKDCEFFITEPDRKGAGHILEANAIDCNDKIVVLNPGGNWGPKRWPADRFAELADKLIKRYNVKILITGAEKDETLTHEVSKNMKNSPISLCGKTKIRELASIFEKAALVISGDSGPMHIAASIGTNVIALFGPTSPNITGPCGKGNYTVIEKQVGCNIPCYDFACKDNRCMKAITADDVINVIEEKGYLKQPCKNHANL